MVQWPTSSWPRSKRISKPGPKKLVEDIEELRVPHPCRALCDRVGILIFTNENGTWQAITSYQGYGAPTGEGAIDSLFAQADAFMHRTTPSVI